MNSVKIIFLLSLLVFRMVGISQDPTENKYNNESEDPNQLVELAWNLLNTSIDSAISMSRLAVSQALESNDSLILSKSYFVLGVSLDYKGNLDQAQMALSKALEISRRVNIIEQKAKALNSIGTIYDRKGKKDSALYYYESALEISVDYELNKAKASILHNIGGLYSSHGNYAQAMTKLLESLKIREETKDTLKIINCLESIAILYQKQKKFDLALNNHYKAFELLGKDGNNHYLGEIISINLADLYLEIDSLDSAQRYIDLVVKISKNIDDDKGLTYALILQADLETLQGEYHKALRFSRKAFQDISEYHYTELHFELQVQQVHILHLLERNLEALDLARDLIDQYYYLGSKVIMRELYENMTDICIDLRMFEMALEYNKIFNAYDDSIYNVQLAGEIADLKLKYENEKNSRVIDKLFAEKELQAHQIRQGRTQIYLLAIGLILLGAFALIIWRLYQSKKVVAQELIHKNVLIEDALVERELLLKEIHHRVKNNLQIVSSLLNLQSETGCPASDVIKACQERIKAMAIIHENLYKSDQIHQLNAKEYIEFLISQYNEQDYKNRPSQIESTICEVNLSIDKLIPIGLIINECMTNTLKYAFSGEKDENVHISMTKNDNFAELVVSDNGRGFDIQKTTSTLGIRLIKGLVQQLNGDVLIESVNGTRYSISFPL